jgi:hypothetical protein
MDVEPGLQALLIEDGVLRDSPIPQLRGQAGLVHPGI